MKTFKVVESSHPWLAENLESSIPSWRFRAARLAGCKVARLLVLRDLKTETLD